MGGCNTYIGCYTERMRRSAALAVLAIAGIAACAAPGASDESESDDEPLTSNDAQLVDYVFDGELVTGPNDDAKKAIVSQLFWTVGPNTKLHKANAQVGRVELSNIVETPENGKKHVTYKAKLPVAWPKEARIDASQKLVLPRDMTAIGAFARRYDRACGEREDAVALEELWYNFDPTLPSCRLAEADVVRIDATTQRDPRVTRTKFPEYDLVWQDGALDVVSVFNSHDGSGRREQVQKFVDGAKARLTNAVVTEPRATGSFLRDITIEGQSTSGHVTIHALEIDSLFESGPDFARRYSPLSAKADLVTYVGHSVLGKNTRALSGMSLPTPGRYQLFFFNSCDSFAYADTTLTDQRVSPSDPRGTKLLDVMTNVLPSFVVDESESLLLLFGALLDRQHPISYQKILGGLPKTQMVVVWGEDDNRFRP